MPHTPRPDCKQPQLQQDDNGDQYLCKIQQRITCANKPHAQISTTAEVSRWGRMGGGDLGMVVAEEWGSWSGCPLNVEGAGGGTGGYWWGVWGGDVVLCNVLGGVV